MGYSTEQEKRYNLVFNYRNSIGVIEKAVELLMESNLKAKWQRKRKHLLSEKIDVTSFLVWFIENYPKSARIMKEDPDYQYRFKSTDFAD